MYVNIAQGRCEKIYKCIVQDERRGRDVLQLQIVSLSTVIDSFPERIVTPLSTFNTQTLSKLRNECKCA